MVISQGDVWWAELPTPSGSAPGFRRPVVVIQGDAFHRSSIRTVVCVAVTSNVKWADSPGNVVLGARASGLRRSSVVNVTQLVTSADCRQPSWTWCSPVSTPCSAASHVRLADVRGCAGGLQAGRQCYITYLIGSTCAWPARAPLSERGPGTQGRSGVGCQGGARLENIGKCLTLSVASSAPCRSAVAATA